MKLKIFNAKNTVSEIGKYQREWMVMMNHRSGTIFFSKECANTLELVNKNVVMVQDEESPRDWYLCIGDVKTDDCLHVRLTTSKSAPRVCIQSVVLVRTIMESIDVLDGSVKMILAKEPTEHHMAGDFKLYALITKSGKAKAAKEKNNKQLQPA